MIETAQVALAIYGALLIAGGIIGKVKAGSSASLFAGAVCGTIALVGFWQSLRDPAVGFLTGGLVGLLLTGIFYEPLYPHAQIYARGLGAIAQSFGGHFDDGGEAGIHVQTRPASGGIDKKRAGTLSR